MKVKLSRPLKVGDKEVNELELDFDRLTGKDVEKAAREALTLSGPPSSMLVLDVAFQIQMAAAACGVEVELLRSMPAIDYVNLTVAAAGFLLSSG